MWAVSGQSRSPPREESPNILCSGDRAFAFLQPSALALTLQDANGGDDDDTSEELAVTSESLNLSDAQTLQVIRSSPEELVLLSIWQPGGTPPRTHWHPRQHEHFEVIEGELTVRLGDARTRVVAAGDSVDVPARTAHSMWNAGPTTCQATWQITPALHTQEMFRTIEARPGPLGMVRMLWTFRHEFRLGSPRRKPLA